MTDKASGLTARLRQKIGHLLYMQDGLVARRRVRRKLTSLTLVDRVFVLMLGTKPLEQVGRSGWGTPACCSLLSSFPPSR